MSETKPQPPSPKPKAQATEKANIDKVANEFDVFLTSLFDSSDVSEAIAGTATLCARWQNGVLLVIKVTDKQSDNKGHALSPQQFDVLSWCERAGNCIPVVVDADHNNSTLFTRKACRPFQDYQLMDWHDYGQAAKYKPLIQRFLQKPARRD